MAYGEDAAIGALRDLSNMLIGNDGGQLAISTVTLSLLLDGGLITNEKALAYFQSARTQAEEAGSPESTIKTINSVIQTIERRIDRGSSA